MLRHTLAACAAVVAATAFSRGNFRVAEADPPAMKLNHSFTPDKPSHDTEFEWTFTRTGFTVRTGKGLVPTHLTDLLLPAVLLALWGNGDLPMTAGLVGLPDLVLAAVFAAWLRRRPRPAQRALPHQQDVRP